MEIPGHRRHRSRPAGGCQTFLARGSRGRCRRTVKRNLPIMNSVSGNPPSPSRNCTFMPCNLWLSPQTMLGDPPPPPPQSNPNLSAPAQHQLGFSPSHLPLRGARLPHPQHQLGCNSSGLPPRGFQSPHSQHQWGYSPAQQQYEPHRSLLTPSLQAQILAAPQGTVLLDTHPPPTHPPHIQRSLPSDLLGLSLRSSPCHGCSILETDWLGSVSWPRFSFLICREGHIITPTRQSC